MLKFIDFTNTGIYLVNKIPHIAINGQNADIPMILIGIGLIWIIILLVSR